MLSCVQVIYEYADLEQFYHQWWKRDETQVIFNWCFIEFPTHPPDPNGALWLAYNVMNY